MSTTHTADASTALPIRPAIALAAAVALAAALILAVAAWLSATKHDDRLTDAYQQCHTYGDSRLADDGQTLIIEGDTTGDTFSCYALFLEMDAATRSAVGTTRALDGVQTGSWDGITARWSFSPSQGLDMTVTTGK